ncbi:MAG TPA: zinc ribbon domain-containing protein [Gemmatimonadales bacterium]|jgi:putative FmdB family regulatory protein
MPTYEYRCPKGHEFERFQKMTDPPRAKCPICGKSAVRQISGGAGLIFKGSGFYITDYGKDGKGPRQDKESESKPESTPAKSAAADSGPEGAPKPETAEPGDRSGKREKSDKSEKNEKSEKSEKKSAKKKASS